MVISRVESLKMRPSQMTVSTAARLPKTGANTDSTPKIVISSAANKNEALPFMRRTPYQRSLKQFVSVEERRMMTALSARDERKSEMQSPF